MKILVIDDDKETTNMLSKFFNAKGYTVEVTNDPMEGLRQIQKEKYDVILLDINMPEISGFCIIELLATDEILKDQNLFIFSGDDMQEIQVKNWLRKDGVNGFLKKPIDLDDLITAITS
jgi:two-component system response regulator VanR